jgi:restriction endonuclease S subunit
MKISFLVPKPKEQQKIANTLSTLDNLIEAQTTGYFPFVKYSSDFI